MYFQHQLAVIVVLCIGAIATGCGGGDATVELSDHQTLAAIQIEAQCNAYWECPQARASSATTGVEVHRFSSPQDCIDSLTGKDLDDADISLRNVGGHELEWGLEEGRIEFDESRFDACRDAVETQWCNGTFEPGAPFSAEGCQGLITGQRTDGDPCLHDWDCADGANCSDREGSQCWDRCQDVDESSANDGADLLCGDDACSEDEYCGRESDTCEQRGTEGDACDPEHRRSCAEEYICTRDESCEEPNLQSEGDACIDRVDVCEPGLVCFADPRGPSTLLSTGHCAPPGDAGDDCRFDHDCEYGLYCIGENDEESRCSRPNPVGEICSTNDHCDDGYCDDGECIELAGAGDSCTRNDECQSGHCQSASCSSGPDHCEVPDEG